MEYPESFYYFSMDNLNIPSFSELHEKSLENTIYTTPSASATSSSASSTYNNNNNNNYDNLSNISSPISSNTSVHSNCTYQQEMLSPTYYSQSFYGTSSSTSTSSSPVPPPQSILPFTPLPPSELGYNNDHFQFNNYNYNNNYNNNNNSQSYQESCFPSPVNSTIEYEHIPITTTTTTTPPPHTVKSHNIMNQMNYSKNEVILTSINDKKRKTISKKQKKINELPYAPNLLNLQLVSIYNNNQSSSSSSNQYNNNNNNNNIKKPKKSISSSTTSTSSSIVTTTNNNNNISQSSSSSSLSPPKKQTKSPSAYKCDFPNCEKTFTRPYNLKSHRRTHTAERPFVCPLCPKSFARQHDRNRHAKLHLGIKPYICHFCDKSFARQDALNRHQRVDDSAGPSCARTSCRKKKKHHQKNNNVLG